MNWLSYPFDERWIIRVWKAGQIKSPSTTAFYRARGVVMCFSGYEDCRDVSALPYGCMLWAIVLGVYFAVGTLVSETNLSVVNRSTMFQGAYGELMGR